MAISLNKESALKSSLEGEGKFTYRRTSARTVSRLYCRFHWSRHGNRSTYVVPGSFIRLMKRHQKLIVPFQTEN